MDAPMVDGFDMDMAYMAKRLEKAEAEIKAWKDAADEWDCYTPEELKERIFSLPAMY